MTKIVAVKGYWKPIDKRKYNCDDMWDGMLVVSDDNWCEGIVKDFNSPYCGDRFVFGVYIPEKCIELFKLTAEGIIDPLKFRAEYVNGEYKGKIMTGLLEETLYGSCIIKVKEFELSNNFINVLRNNVNDWKQNMDDTNNQFYSNVLETKESMINTIKEAHKDVTKKLIKKNKNH